MKTKILDISEYWDSENGEKSEVTIKRIGFGEQNDIIDAVTQTNVKSKTDVSVSTQYGKMKTLMLLTCVVKAPFPITQEYLQKDLDGALGDYLFVEIDKNNGVKRDIKK